MLKSGVQLPILRTSSTLARREGDAISSQSHNTISTPAWSRVAVVVGAAWAVSRLVAYFAGVRFDPEHLRSGWQLLDLAWLREDLVGSLWHLHSQPPLHNLLAGVVSLLAPGREAGAFHLIHLLLGLGVALAMVDVLRRLGVSAAVAGAVTVAFVISPAAIVWENNLSYMLPLAVTLVLGAWAFWRFGARPSFGRGAVAFAVAAVPALTWSLWHLLWLVGLAGALAIARVVPTRRLLAAAAIPVVVVGGWYAKNLVLVSEPVASTWMGVNLFRVVTAEVPQSELDTMAATGDVSPVVAIEEFSPIDAYADVVDAPPAMGHPAADEPRKADGSPNFNHLTYLEASRLYGAAASTVLLADPMSYVKGVTTGVCVFAKPATDYWAVGSNRDQIAGWDRVYSLVAYGQLRTPPLDQGCRLRWLGQGEVALWLPLLFGVALVGTAVIGLRRRDDTAVRAAAVFMAAALAWVALAGNIFELGENHRFRWVTEPLMWVALGLVVDRLVRRRRPGSHRDVPDRTEPAAVADDVPQR